MTTTSKTFTKVNDIFQCKLKLEDGTDFTIPLREDGYIFATWLCKAVGKQVNSWLRLKETKEFIKTLEKKYKNAETSILVSALIEVYKGGNNKYNQGTWIHPDLGLNLAQWCSPSFSLQVSKWLRELIFTGSVELENEKSDEKIKQEYQKIINELNETKEKLQTAEHIILSQSEQSNYIEKKYKRLEQNHQCYLKRRELYKLKEGACIYLINTEGNDTLNFKVGQTGNITDRISGFRTSSPLCKILFLMYTPLNIDIEKNMKLRYEKELLLNNREFISNVPLNDLIDSIIKFAEFLRTNYKIETEEELEKFNSHIISLKDIDKIEIDEEEKEFNKDGKLKRCGGPTHTTSQSRYLDLNEFYKNSGNKDGLARLCRECTLTLSYGDKRKRRKRVVIPKFDTTTHKWCNLCENVKDHKLFGTDKGNKDGLYSNCKTCKAKQKANYIARKKEEKKIVIKT